MKKIGIWLAHPSYEQSFANKFIVDEFSKLESSVRVRHIDKLYPDFKVDQETEQKNLLEVDTIIFQFPIFWFYCPASLKNWMDTVFSFGFAYGPGGNKLEGKNFILSVTTGGPEEEYRNGGHTIQEPLCGFSLAAQLTKLNDKGIIATYHITPDSRQDPATKQKLMEHVQKLQQLS